MIVLSHFFIDKGWTNYELDGIVTLHSGEQVLLPTWHNISKREVIAYSPSLADKSHEGQQRIPCRRSPNRS